ncbi:MAG: methylenetetrahydrofolate--tRNA-(uracil(54)-C(5))-methyltransferase (FADH(2)-oxidizing) TrmFO [candidate division FCPU426 bacterium]
MRPSEITVIGGGLAGCEAAFAAARLGAKVRLYEMRPKTMTPAHLSGSLAELVCSNSLKSLEALSAPWLLKREMLRLGSVTLPAAFEARVPAGANLSVDRALFSAAVERSLAELPGIEVVHERLDKIPEQGLVILATGPLTSEALASDLATRLGQENLFFFDAIAPIVTMESLDMGACFAASRWDRGGADYLNCPLSKEQYLAFVVGLLAAEKHPLKEFEQGKYFEGCLPIEETARRGVETLRFGPMKPVGLIDPVTGQRPYACVQLRRENAAGTLFNLVGFQTQLKWGDQEKLLRGIPALKNAEFARFGSLHRNTYVNAPAQLEGGIRLKSEPRIFLAGQLTGVEGYVESAGSGILAGINAARSGMGLPMTNPPRNTMLGALAHYLEDSDPRHFQPVNAMWGLVEPDGSSKKESKYMRFMRYRDRGIRDFEAWASTLGFPLASAEAVESLARAQAAAAEESRLKASSPLMQG